MIILPNRGIDEHTMAKRVEQPDEDSTRISSIERQLNHAANVSIHHRRF